MSRDGPHQLRAVVPVARTEEALEVILVDRRVVDRSRHPALAVSRRTRPRAVGYIAREWRAKRRRDRVGMLHFELRSQGNAAVRHHRPAR